jgi:hypothetical protein
MGEFVRVEVEQAIATIRLDRPPMNALNSQVQAEIAEAARQVGDDEQVRAVVLYGGEKLFAAGADIKEMSEASYMDMAAMSRRLQDSLTAVARIGKPVVAAITGFPGRRRECASRAAGSPARGDTGRGRHAAAAEAGRSRPSEGHRVYRPVRRSR